MAEPTTAFLLAQTHPSDHVEDVDDLSQIHHKIIKEIALHIMTGMGIFSNVFLLICIFSQGKLRQMSNAFIVHNCLINTVLACFCSLFSFANDANNTLNGKCNMIVTAYMVLMTSAVINVLAMICCELYLFDKSPKMRVSICCVLFNLFLIYGGSVLLHLGSTIIGGNFQVKESSCQLIYKQRRNYINIIMWIVIVSGVLAVCVYYLKRLYIAVQHKLEKRVVSMTRDSINRRSRIDASSLHTSTTTLKRHHSFKHLLQYSSNRAKVLTTVVALVFFCWYPLFALSIFDSQNMVSSGVYDVLTILSLTMPTFQPWIFIVGDSQINQNLPMRVLSSLRRDKLSIGHESISKRDKSNSMEMRHFSNKQLDQENGIETATDWSGTDWDQMYAGVDQLDNLQPSEISMSLTELISIYQDPSERAESFRLSE